MSLPAAAKLVQDGANAGGVWREAQVDIDFTTAPAYPTGGITIAPKDVGMSRFRDVRSSSQLTAAVLNAIPLLLINVAGLIVVQVQVPSTGLQLGNGVNGGKFRLIITGK